MPDEIIEELWQKAGTNPSNLGYIRQFLLEYYGDGKFQPLVGERGELYGVGVERSEVAFI